MIFFFKRKKIIVDAFTYDPGIYEYAPIKKSAHFVPEWWKNLATSNDSYVGSIPVKVPTMKKCVGVSNLFNTGFIIPSYCETSIVVTKQGYWEYSGTHTTKTNNSSHNPEQYGNNFSNYINFKFEMPWIVKEKTGVNFVASPCVWSNSEYWDSMVILNGIVNFKYQNWCNVNTFLRKDDYMLTIPANQPLLQMIPMTEDKVEVKTHLISDNEYDKMFQLGTYKISTLDNYSNLKKIKDMNEQGCPFKKVFGK